MHFFSVFTLMTLVHVLIIIGVSVRVIKVRLPVATSIVPKNYATWIFISGLKAAWRTK
jgi:hypothetical protein